MSGTQPDTPPDCRSCGACCACFRVDFHASELLSEGGTVPDGLSVTVTGASMRLRGTDHVPARCAALGGVVGAQVSCGIYEWRPSPCRELEAGSAACLRARQRHGLAASP